MEDAFDPKEEPSFVEFSLTDDPRALGVGRDTVGLNDDPLTPTAVIREMHFRKRLCSITSPYFSLIIVWNKHQRRF